MGLAPHITIYKQADIAFAYLFFYLNDYPCHNAHRETRYNSYFFFTCKKNISKRWFIKKNVVNQVFSQY